MNYKLVERPTAYDLIEMCTWDFRLFKELHQEFPFELDLRKEPLVTPDGKVLHDSWTFYSMIFTGCGVINKENLENALYLINHNANIDEETWLHFLYYLNDPYDRLSVSSSSSYSYKKRDRKEIKQNHSLITQVIQGLIRMGADPLIKDEEGKYRLIDALHKMNNKEVLEELSKNSEVKDELEKLEIRS